MKLNKRWSEYPLSENLNRLNNTVSILDIVIKAFNFDNKYNDEKFFKSFVMQDNISLDWYTLGFDKNGTETILLYLNDLFVLKVTNDSIESPQVNKDARKILEFEFNAIYNLPSTYAIKSQDNYFSIPSLNAELLDRASQNNGLFVKIDGEYVEVESFNYDGTSMNATTFQIDKDGKKYHILENCFYGSVEF